MLARKKAITGILVVLALFLIVLLGGVILSKHQKGKTLATLKGDAFSVSALEGGGILIEADGEGYVIESYFSYPGKSIGFNKFANDGRKGEEISAIKVSQLSDNVSRIEGDFVDYSITRTLKLVNHRIEVSETIHNRRNNPVGVLVEHKLMGKSFFGEIFLGGFNRTGIVNFSRQIIGRMKEVTQIAENPTVYVRSGASSMGIAVRDSLFRLQVFMNSAIFRSNVTFGLRNFSLEPNRNYTFQWDMYPMSKSSNYFSMINRIRADWEANFTVLGPFDFFDVILNSELIRNQIQLKAYFQRKKVAILALTPWLDYTHYNFARGDFLTREEYKSLMENALKAIKGADRSIRVIGCIENNLVSLPPEIEEALLSGVRQKERELGIFKSSVRETDIIRKSNLKYKDSLIVTEDGKYVLELYGQMRDEINGEMGDGPTRNAVAVYSRCGNSQFENLMEQARFITDHVGLDGIYIDQFNMAFDKLQRYSYERPDGITADIDKKTGEIIRKYTDGSFVGIEARKELINSILSKGKIMVANTHAEARELQSEPVYRFVEGGRIYNPLSLNAGQKPRYNAYLAKGHLGSPIALGERHWSWGKETKDSYAKFIMKNIVVFLRHGLLYYCFNTEIPEHGKGGGEFGPLNHMFPITPRRLGEGFIEGEERIITAVSGEFTWRQERRPSVATFDMEGRRKVGDYNVEKVLPGWRVQIKLNDWEEIAVVYYS